MSKDYKYFLDLQRKVATIAASVNHNCNITMSAYSSSNNGNPFLVVSALEYDGAPYVHFNFYDFNTKKHHKEVLAAFKTYLQSGQIVRPARVYGSDKTLIQ